jgi:hypothetical protein
MAMHAKCVRVRKSDRKNLLMSISRKMGEPPTWRSVSQIALRESAHGQQRVMAIYSSRNDCAANA